MSTEASPNERRADARRNRDRLLDAATTVLAANPAPTIADIAAEAGVSRATAYRHFPDVDAVRAALMQEAQDVGRDLLQETLAPLFDGRSDQGPIIDQAEHILRVALPLQHRWTRTLAGQPLPDAGFLDTFTPIATALLKRGQARGEIRADLDLEIVSGALITLALHAVRRIHSEGLPPDRALDIMRPYLAGLRRPDGA